MARDERVHEHVLVRRHERGEPGVAASFAEAIWDRPEKRNALTPGMLDAFSRAVEQLSADSGIGAICVTGEGNVFCAGFDLPLCVEDEAALGELLRALSRAVRVMKECAKPVVVGAHGAAVAGGCALLAGADVVVAERSCKLGYPVANLGISPAVSAPTLRAVMGIGASRTRLLDPGLADGGAAHGRGLIDIVVETSEDVRPRAQLEAMKLAGKPAGAIAATKAWINETDGSLDERAVESGLRASLSLENDGDMRRRLERFVASSERA